MRIVEDPPYLREARMAGVRIDYIGIGLLVLGIGALQVMLDKGQEDDWFGSRFITAFAITAAVCLVSLIIWEWFRKDAIIDVRLFKNFNYLASNTMMFTLGIVYFSSLVIMPQFLQNLMGYTAELSGLALSASGLALLLLMPIVGQLTSRVQARYLIAFGWLTLAFAMYYSQYRLDLQISFRTAAWISVVQRIGLPFLFVPITLVVYVGIPPEKSGSAAGMINFMRNIGSSIGTSFVTTVTARRGQFHQNNLVPHISSYNPAFQDAVNSLAARLADSGLSPTTARDQAYARVYRSIQNQTSNLAYIDVFWLLMIAAIVMFFGSFFLKRNEPGAGGEVAAG